MSGTTSSTWSLPPTRRSSTPLTSPALTSAPILGASLLPPNSGNAAAGPSSASLHRQGSGSSQRSSRPSLRGMIPSPRIAPSMPPPSSQPSSATSSASGSRAGSIIHTPKLLSRRSSAKESSKPSSLLMRKASDRAKGKGREEEGPQSAGGAYDGWRSPTAELDPIEIIETPHATRSTDPETGLKMINQYVVMKLIGQGAHGQVRLGRDVTVEVQEDGESTGLSGTHYAIKMVERMPKRKRLQTLRKGYGRTGTDGGKMVMESEIRKEVAIFKKVNHPNVVRLREIIDDPDQSRIFMILEYCERGEIKWKDEDGGPAMTIAETRKIFRDTLSGLAYRIIHRDIKPSNLLLSHDGTVKISDFGCSHYSEALRAASAQPDGDRYVDDVELAKTAGSPAFFAPEMCYSGLDDDIVSTRESLSPLGTPVLEVPGFTLRPPSVSSEFGEPRPSRSDPLVLSPGGKIIPLKQIKSNDSGVFNRRPISVRSHSSHTLHQKREPRLPITNAIDVWALGVTLYCLLFGRTPFDAPNEYLLMQVIPVADFEVPAFMGREYLPTSGPEAPAEAREAIDLLRRLLEKVPGKRITLDQAKRHPFTLRDLTDPTTWLAGTDPHAQDYVTVSNDEVLAAVTKSMTFRDRFRKGMKSIGHRLQALSGGSRHRARSIGDFDQLTSGIPSAEHSIAPSAAGSTINLTAAHLAGLESPPLSLRQKSRKQSMSRDISPMGSPQAAGPSRRFSMLGGQRFAEPSAQSPRPATSTIQLGSPTLLAQPEVTNPSPIDEAERAPTQVSHLPSSAKGGFVIHRPKVHQPSHLVPPSSSRPPTSVPMSDVPRSPVKMASSASLDKYARPSSPPGLLQRRSSDMEVQTSSRQRAPSNASSAQASLSGFGKLVKLISRTSSSRSGSRFSRRSKAERSVGSDADDHAVSTTASPVDALRRISLADDDDHNDRSRVSHDGSRSHSDHDGVTSSSYSSHIGMLSSPGQSQDDHGHSAPIQWTSRLPASGILPIRRNSSPNTAVSALTSEELGGDDMEEELDIAEPLDWDGKASDDEGYDVTPGDDEEPSLHSPLYDAPRPLRGKQPHFTSPFRESSPTGGGGLGLIAQQLQVNGRTPSVDCGPPVLPPLATMHTLEAIPDASPPDDTSLDTSPVCPKTQTHSSPYVQAQPISPTSSTRSPTPRYSSSTSPTNTMGNLDMSHAHNHNWHRSSSRTSSRASGSPYRPIFDRARSPLGRLSDEEDSLSSGGPRRASMPSPSRPVKPELSPTTGLGVNYHGQGQAQGTGYIHVAQAAPPPPLPLGSEQHMATAMGMATSLSSTGGSPQRYSLARQSSSGSGFASIRNGPVTPGSSNASGLGAAAGGAVGVGEMGQIGRGGGGGQGREEGEVQVVDDDDDGLAINFGSKRGRKGSVMRERHKSETGV